ncbi:hypothetical protein FEM48_Zijuj09G0047200 [Ziziphus jujuba var. spinosa]|uniref:Uncharacterized protein n=1 Tax=Ziziphus jujuba var. spinosa TaxID=714518 RepID=A0A978UQY4_ZIZJJ|nr:hypothetical protein FEM48_Zijuj09G0047200 [Ziziphus jujuba var. spinosa]
MPFPMKIQPIDCHTLPHEPTCFEPVKPVVKSRLKRLFERQFTSVLRTSVAEKTGVDEPHFSKGGFNGSDEFEPSSVCLAKMVQNFIEESTDKSLATAKCSWNRGKDGSVDELDFFSGIGDSNFVNCSEACEILKGLVPCASVCERNLLADTAKIVEKSKICKPKDDVSRMIVADRLSAMGYNSSICKSRWEKSHSYPAGEYEYIDVIIQGERLLIDIDFRSEFEIARPTKTYKTILQTLPYIFVGKADRLQRIISVVSEAAKQSLKKKGMHIPPWRRAEYVKAKWLSPHTRETLSSPSSKASDSLQRGKNEPVKQPLILTSESQPNSCGERKSVDGTVAESVFDMSESSSAGEKKTVVNDWKPPELKPRRSSIGLKIVTGLASVMDDEP